MLRIVEQLKSLEISDSKLSKDGHLLSLIIFFFAFIIAKKKQSWRKSIFFLTQIMLVAPSVWNQEDNVVSAEFKIPKLNSPQQVQFFMEPIDNPHFSCSITYDDSKEKIVIPFMVLRYLYHTLSTNLCTIPIQWDFQQSCTIHLKNRACDSRYEDWSKTRSIICKIGNLESDKLNHQKISGFCESARFKLEPQQLIRTSGIIGINEECEKVIIVFSVCVNVKDLYGFKVGDVLDICCITSGYEAFVTCHELNGYFQVFTRGSKPIEVQISKRKVVMLFEDPQKSYEFKEKIIESDAVSLPEWTGETLVYRNFEAIFDIGKHITHVYFFSMLNDTRKTQVACLLGLSLNELDLLLFNNLQKDYICLELSGLFSINKEAYDIWENFVGKLKI
jgi:hypothetical protein